MKETLVLFLDVETTGLNPKTDEITEVGAVLYHWEFGRVVESFQKVLRVEQAIPGKIERMTLITNRLSVHYGSHITEAMAELEKLVTRAEFIIAHNAEFDRSFLKHHLPAIDEKHWICSRYHVPYPESITSHRLIHLAAEHEFLNPFPHQVMADVMTMMKLVTQYDFNEIIYRSKSGWAYLHAGFSRLDKDNFEVRKETAKKLGYRWNPDPILKWIKRVQEFEKDQVIREHSKFFPVYEIHLNPGEKVNA